MNKLHIIYTACGLLAFAIFIGIISWSCRAHNLAQEKYFAPKEADVNRETFEHSKAFRDGTIRDLQDMQRDYIKGDDSQRQALRSIILHRAAEIDTDALPHDLRLFINSIK